MARMPPEGLRSGTASACCHNCAAMGPTRPLAQTSVQAWMPGTPSSRRAMSDQRPFLQPLAPCSAPSL
eukprot:11228178-Lingulodinium_polyedra.AAC.1